MAVLVLRIMWELRVGNGEKKRSPKACGCWGRSVAKRRKGKPDDMSRAPVACLGFPELGRRKERKWDGKRQNDDASKMQHVEPKGRHVPAKQQQEYFCIDWTL